MIIAKCVTADNNNYYGVFSDKKKLKQSIKSIGLIIIRKHVKKYCSQHDKMKLGNTYMQVREPVDDAEAYNIIFLGKNFCFGDKNKYKVLGTTVNQLEWEDNIVTQTFSDLVPGYESMSY